MLCETHRVPLHRQTLTVLILVLMEDALREVISGEESPTTEVS